MAKPFEETDRFCVALGYAYSKAAGRSEEEAFKTVKMIAKNVGKRLRVRYRRDHRGLWVSNRWSPDGPNIYRSSGTRSTPCHNCRPSHRIL